MRLFIGLLLVIAGGFAHAEIILQTDGRLYWVDTTNGSHTELSNCGCSDLAYDRVNGRLFAVQRVGDPYTPNDLYEIDLTTGTRTTIGTINIPIYSSIQALAYDAENDLFYVANWWGDYLWLYDPTTNTTSRGARTNQRYIASLTFNPNNGLLYGARRVEVPWTTSDPVTVEGGIFFINPANGNLTPLPVTTQVSKHSISWGTVGSPGWFNGYDGTAYDPESNLLYFNWPYIRTLELRPYIENFVGYQASGISTDGIEVNVAKAISVDIDPWSDANLISVLPDKTTSVALLSTSIAAGDSVDFDATEVDLNTVRFGPDAAPITAPPILTDLDGDSDTDLVLGFSAPDAGIRCESDYDPTTNRTYVWLNESYAMVVGTTANGEHFGGSDFIEPKFVEGGQSCTETSCHP